MTGKERLIELLKLLYVQTDEDHPLSTAQIVSYFKEQNVTTDRETVKVDVAALNNCGIEIYATKGTQTKYYFSDRRFELAELKLLVDAVESSKFITAKKSGELVKKLMGLTSQANATELVRHLYTSGRIKPDNEAIFLATDVIFKALSADKQISFLYYEYTQDKSFVPRHDGEPYFFSPYAMLYNEDKYYLLGYDDCQKKLKTYRVDRMKSVRVLDAPVIPRPEGFDPIDYTVDVFSMFDGKSKLVKLRCANKLMNYVVDRFGDDVQTTPANNSHFDATVKVSVSQTFFAWVFQFAGDMRIISPKSVKDEYRKMLETACELAGGSVGSNEKA
ncbi:MAG: WYL domain-containing protein [Bacteroidia bacterium]|jgi:predicted DNA-binding transcriptional regulator YafY|nr:WYL domain-containing protein [Bacteroidia bacterium]